MKRKKKIILFTDNKTEYLNWSLEIIRTNESSAGWMALRIIRHQSILTNRKYNFFTKYHL